MIKFTPGPWSALDLRTFLWDGRKEIIQILGPEGESGGCPVLANIRISKERPVPAEAAEANARLISAAPELLLACQGMLNVVRLWPHVNKDEAEAYLVEVIAKAEGK